MKRLILFLPFLTLVSMAQEIPVHQQNDLNSKIIRFQKSFTSQNQGLHYPDHIQEKLANAYKVKIAIIDTGVDVHHPFLQDGLISADSDNQKATLTNFGLDFSNGGNPTKTPYDFHGHGTHIAGIIKSLNNNTGLLGLKYYNPQSGGNKNLEATIKALKQAILNKVDIINYSGGGSQPSIEELKLLKLADEKGILVIVAAGNNGLDLDDQKNAYYPASYNLPNMIRVTAYNETQHLLRSANWGKKTVDLAAPGQNIISTLPNSRMGKLTGTSQATAFVTGLASIIKGLYPHLNAYEIKEIILESSQKDFFLTQKCRSGALFSISNALSVAKKYYNLKNNSNTKVLAHYVAPINFVQENLNP